ncbi:MAG: DUF3617 domain-containing protein [Candidatus Acidiferrales bacterium]
MLGRILLGLLVLFPFTIQSDSTMQPLNVKPGLWEVAVTMNGLPAMPAIPDSILAQMPPDQRAKMEAMMKGQPITTKSCVTKDKLEKSEAFRNAPKSCTYTIVSSTSSKLEMKTECTKNGTKMTGNFLVEAIDSEHIKGSMRMNSSGGNTSEGNNAMNMNTTFTEKWLGADCGEVH